MELSELGLNVDDTINYSRRGKHNNDKHYKGVITHMTNKIIAVDLGKYPDSISISDLACGMVRVIGIPKPVITTSEINTPYRPENELKRETPQTSEYKIKGETQRAKEEQEAMEFKERDYKTDPLTPEELSDAWEVAGHKINPVANIFGISWQDTKKLLKNAGLLEDYRGIQTKQKEGVKPKDKLNNKPVNKPVCEPDNQPPEPPKDDPLTAEILSLHEDGTVNWKTMWPIVQAELDKGRDKFEVAAELGIPRAAMQKKFYKMVTKPARLAKKEAVKSECQVSSGIEQYRLKTRSELLSIRGGLQTDMDIIDLILSCINATLAEVQADADV